MDTGWWMPLGWACSFQPRESVLLEQKGWGRILAIDPRGQEGYGGLPAHTLGGKAHVLSKTASIDAI